MTVRRAPVGLLVALLIVSLYLLVGARPPQAGEGSSAIPIRQIGLADAPAEVREAASFLAHSRIAYGIAGFEVTYLIIAASDDGPPLRLAGAGREAQSPPAIAVRLETDPGGSRLIIAELKAVVADPLLIGYTVDGQPDLMPRLINPHGLSVVTLPQEGELLLLPSQTGMVSGFARLPEGKISLASLPGGSGARGSAYASAAWPDWGSFAVRMGR